MEGESPAIKQNCRHTRLHHELLVSLEDNMLEQMVEVPTRDLNTKHHKDLKSHKAAGPDSMRPIILKTLHKEISPMLTFLFQQSPRSGVLPIKWRQANVVT